MMLSLNITIVLLLIVQDVFLWLILKYKFIDHAKGPLKESWPRVSILIPARNEGIDLPACLRSLEKIDYPKGKLQIIVADDESRDNTGVLLAGWASEASNRVFVPLDQRKPEKINGKAYALSQMARWADGELFLFTDADCEVNPFWVKELVSAFRKESGLVTGITAVRTSSLFSCMQSLDWWLTLGMVKATSDLAYSLTAMGNNMLVSKRAYWEVGGFENLPFSVTEDFELAQALVSKGYRPIHQVSPGSLVMTKSERSFFDLLRQRKRWMKGAMSLPWYWVLLLGLQGGFFPAVLYLLPINSLFGITLWLLKILVQSFLIRSFAAKSGVRIAFPALLLFELYYLIILWCTILYYFWPIAINWKGRRY